MSVNLKRALEINAEVGDPKHPIVVGWMAENSS